MIKLYIDVSTEIMYIALSKDDAAIDVSIRLGKRDHAKYVVDRIHQILEKNKLTIEDVSELIVGEGPGSYTGIRMAVTVAKTLAYTKNIPLYSVSSLIFMTSGFKGLVCATHDARRGYVFASIYENDNVILKSQYIHLDELKALPAYFNTHWVQLDHTNYQVDLLMIEKHKHKIIDVHNFEPNYTRLTEAEEHGR
jgi:tRNA threonylcarbamoyladenosine biosynthesis protein TsaB